MDGIITFNTLDELESIVSDVWHDPTGFYESKKDAIKENFELAQKYVTPEDWLYDNILKDILNDT